MQNIRFRKSLIELLKKKTHLLSNDIILDSIVVIREIVNTTLSPYFCSNDKLFEKMFLQELNITINVNKQRNKYIMLNNNAIVIVNNIVQL